MGRESEKELEATYITYTYNLIHFAVNLKANIVSQVYANKFFLIKRILNATRGRQQIAYKGIPVSPSAEFSAETLQIRREWHDILKMMKEKNLQPRILYPEGAHLDFMEKSKALQTSKS